MKFLSFILFFFLFFISVESEVIQWTASFGEWNNASNWNVSRVPDAFDDVLLPSSETNYTVFVGGYSNNTFLPARAKSIFISSTASLDLFGIMNVTDTIISYGMLTLYEHRGQANYTILVGGTSIHCAAGILSGVGTIETPSLFMANNTVLAVHIPASQTVSLNNAMPRVKLVVLGNLLLSELSVVQLWVANSTNDTGYGAIEVGSSISLAGELQIVQLNGMIGEIQVPLMTWGTSYRAFSTLSFINVTKFQAPRCGQPDPFSLACPSPNASIARAPCLSRFQCEKGWCSLDGYCGGCKDGIKNIDETDVDCGGGSCHGCPPNYTCNLASDCVIPQCSVCNSSVCILDPLCILPDDITPPTSPPNANAPIPPSDGCANYRSTGLQVLFSPNPPACDAVCPYGWTDFPACQVPLCEPVLSDPAGHTFADLCSGHGACIVSGDIPGCACDPGFQGRACDLPACPGSPFECSQRGTCELAASGGICSCTSPGWGGSDCNTPACINGCSSHGRCVAGLNDVPVCSCNQGFYSVDCSLRYCPGTTDASQPLASACSGQGTCDPLLGACRCDPGFSGPDCSISGGTPPQENTTVISCPSSCNGAGACQADGTCACDALHGGSACQYNFCEATSRATFLELEVEFLLQNSSQDLFDAFLSSQLLTDLIESIAVIAEVPASSICLTRLTRQSLARASSETLFPTFALDPPPKDPYACNTVCPEATLAMNQTLEALQNATRPTNYPWDSVVEYSQVQIQWQDTCVNSCSDPLQGTCRFGVCICTNQWTGQDCAIPSCPGEPDCSNHGTCYTNYTEAPFRRCSCDKGWEGEACEIGICPFNCSGAGVCSSDGEIPFCLCDPSYLGEACESQVRISFGNESTLRWVALGCIAFGVVFIIGSILSIRYIPFIRSLFFGPEASELFDARRYHANLMIRVESQSL